MGMAPPPPSPPRPRPEAGEEQGPHLPSASRPLLTGGRPGSPHPGLPPPPGLPPAPSQPGPAPPRARPRGRARPGVPAAVPAAAGGGRPAPTQAPPRRPLLLSHFLLGSRPPPSAAGRSRAALPPPPTPPPTPPLLRAAPLAAPTAARAAIGQRRCRSRRVAAVRTRRWRSARQRRSWSPPPAGCAHWGAGVPFNAWAPPTPLLRFLLVVGAGSPTGQPRCLLAGGFVHQASPPPPAFHWPNGAVLQARILAAICCRECPSRRLPAVVFRLRDRPVAQRQGPPLHQSHWSDNPRGG